MATPAWGPFAVLSIVLALGVVALARMTTSALREASHGLGDTRPSLDALSTLALTAEVAVSHGVLGGIVVVGAVWAAIPAEALGADPAAMGSRWLVLGAGLGVVGAVINESLAAVADRAGVAYSKWLRGALAPDDAAGWVLLLGVVLPIGALVEELLFRAALIGAIGAGFGVSPWVLAVGSSLLFGLAHGVQGRVGIAVTGLLGFGLAAAFIVTGSLLAVIVAHWVVNAMEFIVHEAPSPTAPRRGGAW